MRFEGDRVCPWCWQKIDQEDHVEMHHPMGDPERKVAPEPVDWDRL